MTKKELLESELFKMTPDDAEIVFRTNKRMNLCCKLKPEHLSLRIKSGTGYEGKGYGLRLKDGSVLHVPESLFMKYDSALRQR